MFFKKIKDIIINPKEITLILELIDSNTKEYKLINGKLKNKNNYLKGYFKNELIDFNLRYNDSGNYQFSCHIYKDDSYLSKSTMSITDLEDKYTFTTKEQMDWLYDNTSTKDEFEKHYFSFINSRFDIMKKKMLDNYDNL